MYCNESLLPANIFMYPNQERFQDSYRKWQGIPSIEVSHKGRVFVNFYSGQEAEVGGNIMILCTSDDGGKSFQSCIAVVEHPHPECRIYDPNLWLDPLGRLWMFWTQAHNFNDARSGVFAAICDDPDAEKLSFGSPRRIANGIMMNKPIVMANGEWLFPCAIWCDDCGAKPTENHGLESEKFSNVYISPDAGKSFFLRGGADVPERSFDEHMVIEKLDHTLWMLVRTFYGIGESFSKDYGYTWTKGGKSLIRGPCSRFHITRLKSGRMLLINYYNFREQIDIEDIMNQGNVKTWKGRSHLTALLSEDDGTTWPFSILIDERNNVSYPDAKEADDGYIYVTYDWERVKEREIFLAKFTEDDILKGNIQSPNSQLRVSVNKALGR